MAGNYFEQLVAEWYEFKGYFVRRNIRVGRRAKGGHEGELDVVVFHPSKKHLVHIESSLDAQKWEKREERFAKKFAAGRKHIPKIFEGFDLPTDIEQIALLLLPSKGNRQTLGGGKLVTVAELLEEIFAEIKPLSIYSNSIPEDKPILRSFQYVAQYRQNIFRALGQREI
jgi:hypothetical protein